MNKYVFKAPNMEKMTISERIAVLAEVKAMVDAASAFIKANDAPVKALGPGKHYGNRNTCATVIEVAPTQTLDSKMVQAKAPDIYQACLKNKAGYTSIRW